MTQKRRSDDGNELGKRKPDNSGNGISGTTVSDDFQRKNLTPKVTGHEQAKSRTRTKTNTPEKSHVTPQRPGPRFTRHKTKSRLRMKHLERKMAKFHGTGPKCDTRGIGGIGVGGTPDKPTNVKIQHQTPVVEDGRFRGTGSKKHSLTKYMREHIEKSENEETSKKSDMKSGSWKMPLKSDKSKWQNDKNIPWKPLLSETPTETIFTSHGSVHSLEKFSDVTPQVQGLNPYKTPQRRATSSSPTPNFDFTGQKHFSTRKNLKFLHTPSPGGNLDSYQSKTTTSQGYVGSKTKIWVEIASVSPAIGVEVRKFENAPQIEQFFKKKHLGSNLIGTGLDFAQLVKIVENLKHVEKLSNTEICTALLDVTNIQVQIPSEPTPWMPNRGKLPITKIFWKVKSINPITSGEIWDYRQPPDVPRNLFDGNMWKIYENDAKTFESISMIDLGSSMAINNLRQYFLEYPHKKKSFLKFMLKNVQLNDPNDHDDIISTLILVENFPIFFQMTMQMITISQMQVSRYSEMKEILKHFGCLDAWYQILTYEKQLLTSALRITSDEYVKMQGGKNPKQCRKFSQELVEKLITYKLRMDQSKAKLVQMSQQHQNDINALRLAHEKVVNQHELEVNQLKHQLTSTSSITRKHYVTGDKGLVKQLEEAKTAVSHLKYVKEMLEKSVDQYKMSAENAEFKTQKILDEKTVLLDENVNF